MRKKYQLNVLYEDDSLIVCDKPAGLPVQTAKSGEQDLVSQLKAYRLRNGEEPYIGVIHRLDQPVRGLIALAKTQAAAANLSKQIATRTPLKEYLAVVCPKTNSENTISVKSSCNSNFFAHAVPHSTEYANPNDMAISATGTEFSDYAANLASERSLQNSAPDNQNDQVNLRRSLPASGELHDYLLRDGRTNTSHVVPKGTPGAKEALLSYEVVRTSSETGRILVRIQLHTGRHHQIRAQFSHAGFPLYADSKYGQPLPRGCYYPVALCSCRIGFHHPETGKWVTFTLKDAEAGFMGLLS